MYKVCTKLKVKGGGKGGMYGKEGMYSVIGVYIELKRGRGQRAVGRYTPGGTSGFGVMPAGFFGYTPMQGDLGFGLLDSEG